jgi:hypothetical protein
MEGLLAHVDSHKLTRNDLRLIPAPEGTDTFRPIAHAELVDSIHETLSFRHINVVKDEYAVSDDGMKLFGVMELETAMNGFRFALGLRNANNRSMRLGLVVGIKVFCCDNMAFYGDFQPVLAKHSKHFNLVNALAVGIDQMQRNFKPMAEQVEAWRAAQIEDDDARSIIYRAFIEDQLDAPKHLAKVVHANYFNPQIEDFTPRTMWSLQNAFTGAFKQLEPIPMYRATASLGQFFQVAP